MKKRNLVIPTAVAAALITLIGSVHATTISPTSTSFAREILLGTAPNTTTLALQNVVVVANSAIPANSTVYVYVRTIGASLAAFPTVTGVGQTTIRDADNLAGAGPGVSYTLTAGSLGSTTGTANPTGVAAGVDYVVFQLNTGTGVVGVGGTVATISGLLVNNAASLLTSPLTVTASVGVGAPTSRFGAFAATATNYDSTSVAGTVATAAQGITLSSAASRATAKIDLTASVPSTLFTPTTGSVNDTGSTSTIRLGTFTLVDGTSFTGAGTNNAYATGGKTAAVTVNAAAGFFAPATAAGALSTRLVTGASVACSGVVAGTSAVITAAVAAAATSVSIPAVNYNAGVTPGTTFDVCMTVNGTTAIATGASTLNVTLGAAAASDSAQTIASANLLALTSNGQQVDVRSYIPASTAGYTTYIRVINTGSVSAALTGSFLNADGTTGSPATLATMAAGSATTFTSSQIEAILGAPVGGSTVRPRLRLSAPTTGMNAQSFILTNANGTFSDVTGAQ